MIRPWMLLAVMILVGGAVFSVAVYKKWSDDDDHAPSKKEEFEAERPKAPGSKPAADAGTAKPAADAGRAKPDADAGTAKPDADAGRAKPDADAGRAKPQGSAREKPRDVSASLDKPGAKLDAKEEPAPASGQVTASILRRMEDELENIANRIDGILEELAASRTHAAGGKDGVVEGFASFGGYHPGM